MINQRELTQYPARPNLFDNATTVGQLDDAFDHGVHEIAAFTFSENDRAGRQIYGVRVPTKNVDLNHGPEP